MLVAIDAETVNAAAAWFTGIVAALALIFAARGAKAALKAIEVQNETLRLQREQLEDQQRQIRVEQETLVLQRRQFEDSKNQVQRSQAEKITLWRDWDEENVKVINASESPIYEVLITFAFGAGDEPGLVAKLPVVLPTGAEPLIVDAVDRDVWIDPYMLSLYFRDAAGRFWVREEPGELTRTTSDEFTGIHSDMRRYEEPDVPNEEHEE